MNKNILIVLAGGFLIAVVVALMVQASLSGAKKKEVVAAKQEARVEILAAAKPLKAGETLSADNMKWSSWPKAGVFPGAVVRKGKDQTAQDALQGKMLQDIAEGEPITSSMIVKEKSNMMAAKLRPGMRAVSIDAKASAQVSGLINPGDYVDVILTYRSKIKYGGSDDSITNMVNANLTKMASETIMENVRILAVDQRVNAPSETKEGDGKKKAAKAGKLVTLEVTPEGAEVIAMARKAGDLTLSLRRLGENDVSDHYTPATTDSRVTNIWHEIYATMEKMNNVPAGQGSNIVRIYSGASASNVNVGQ